MTATLSPDPTPTTLHLSVTLLDAFDFPSAFASNSLFGYLVLDVDQNPSTGVPPGSLDPFMALAGQLGIDFFVDLFSEASGQVELVDANFNPVTTLAFAFNPLVDDKTFSVTMNFGEVGGPEAPVADSGVRGGARAENDRLLHGGMIAQPALSREPGKCYLATKRLHMPH